MKPEDIILLFQLIRQNGDVNNLIEKGYRPDEILEAIKKEMDNGYIVFKGNILILTEEGEQALKTLNQMFKRKKSEALISPQSEYYVNKINADDIYLPKKF